MKPRMTDVVLPPTFEQTASFTPGKWEFREIYPYDDGLGYISADGHDIIHAGVSDLSAEENRANAHLTAEAGAVANETGLTPRQLAEQRAELLAALAGIVDLQGKSAGGRPLSESELREWSVANHNARAAIAKAKAGA